MKYSLRAFGALALVACALAVVGTRPRQAITMLDIGQGDSFLLQDGATQVLIDGGPGSEVLTRLGEEMPFFDRKIDVIIATHYDRDHLEGLLHVVNKYDVGMILMPHYTATTTATKRQFLQTVIDKHIPYRFGWYGQTLSVGHMQFRIMSPIPGPEWESLSKRASNNASIIMRMDYTPKPGARPLSALFTGDAEGRIEKQLLSSISLSAFDVDILKVGHHGSKTSTTPELVQAASPGVAFISVGASNTYGHPTKEALSRLSASKIFRTDQDGTVSFWFDGTSWRESCRKKTDLIFLQQLCMKR